MSELPPESSWERTLEPEERGLIDAARQACQVRYEGVVVPHRSCGIALAETFGLATPPYQSLRKGGLLGRGECGTAVAGRLVLGELLGDPDPGGSATPALREAISAYEARWDARTGVAGSRVCNDLTRPFVEFRGSARAGFCTSLAAETAALVAEVLIRHGHHCPVVPVGSPRG